MKLDIKSIDEDVCDADVAILHASFQILADYMERGHYKILRWPKGSKILKTMLDLNKWWTEERPARKSPLDTPECRRLERNAIEETKPEEDGEWVELHLPDMVKHSRLYEIIDENLRLEDEWKEEDQRNLHRLINIRPFLWT